MIKGYKATITKIYLTEDYGYPDEEGKIILEEDTAKFEFINDIAIGNFKIEIKTITDEEE